MYDFLFLNIEIRVPKYGFFFSADADNYLLLMASLDKTTDNFIFLYFKLITS